MFDFTHSPSRRVILGAAGFIAASAAMPALAQPGNAVAGAGLLPALTRKLQAAPRRRNFTRVPFLVDKPDLWDHEAAAEILRYPGKPCQVWENSDLGSAWLNLMREALNGQVFAHDHADFLEVSATHGAAHLALFNQAMWDKYKLAERTNGLATRNSFIIEKPGTSPVDDRHDIGGFYGVANNNIVSLQRRGMVFVGCHDTVHATARSLTTGDDADGIAAELTNNLIPGVVLVPSVVAFLAELQQAGFTYAKGA